MYQSFEEAPARASGFPVEDGEVAPHDERLSAVEDHELLVMTVHRSLATIGCDVKSRAIGQLGHHRLDLAPPGPEQR